MIPRFAANTGQVAIGVGVNGVATLIMLSAAARGSGEEGFAAFSTWWLSATLLVYPLGAVEAVLTRTVVTDVVRQRSISASRATMVRAMAPVLGVGVVTLCLLERPLREGVFRGFEGFGYLLAIHLLVGFVQSVQRGICAGRNRFDGVRRQLVADGVLRVAMVSAAAVAGGDPRVLAGAATCAGAVALLAPRAASSTSFTLRPAPRGPVRSAVLLLMLGAAGPVLINNAPAPWLATQVSDAAAVGSFATALTLSRVPTQAGAAAFGPLLQRMADLVERGERTHALSLVRRVMLVATGVGLCFTIAFTMAGPWCLRQLLGSGYEAQRTTLALLGLCSTFMLLALIAQAPVIADERWLRVTASWLVAGLAVMGILLGPGAPLLRAALAPLAGSLVGAGALTLAMALRLLGETGRSRPPHNAGRSDAGT